MTVLDGFWHLANFVAPALFLAAFCAAAAKLLWRGELRGVSWRRVLLWGFAPALVVAVVGLVWSGRDGRMSTYAAMVVGSALGVWWRCFLRR